jgi:hypothetical protein
MFCIFSCKSVSNKLNGTEPLKQAIKELILYVTERHIFKLTKSRILDPGPHPEPYEPIQHASPIWKVPLCRGFHLHFGHALLQQ